jgi:hypothetical protein
VKFEKKFERCLISDGSGERLQNLVRKKNPCGCLMYRKRGAQKI